VVPEWFSSQATTDCIDAHIEITVAQEIRQRELV
jgi:hypothetical protein